MPEGPAKTLAMEKADKLKKKSDEIRSEVNRIQNEGRKVTLCRGHHQRPEEAV